MNKVVFLGAKEVGFECLNYLLQNQSAFEIEIIGVGSKPNKNRQYNLQELAVTNKIEHFVHPDDIPACDFIVSVQYHQILKKNHIIQAKQLAINLHMAPLPEYRGCNAFSFAIIENKKYFGTTIHELTPGIDNGDILFERRFDISSDIWVKDLISKTTKESILLFKNNILSIFKKQFSPISQKELIAERGSSFHLRKEIEELKKLDINWPKEKLEKQIRATYCPPFPPPYFHLLGKKVEIVIN